MFDLPGSSLPAGEREGSGVEPLDAPGEWSVGDREQAVNNLASS